MTPDDYELDESWDRTQAYWASPEGVERQLEESHGARCSICAGPITVAGRRYACSCLADERYDAMEQAR